ncbi:hypothetical protein Bbelb_374470 [Branchiostoma belcheri]|nr:hypothetical protein Bbelb_374470 [Branchiostoma belcheri]
MAAKKCGVVLCDSLPSLAATPDAMVQCTCCDLRSLELGGCGKSGPEDYEMDEEEMELALNSGEDQDQTKKQPEEKLEKLQKAPKVPKPTPRAPQDRTSLQDRNPPPTEDLLTSQLAGFACPDQMHSATFVANLVRGLSPEGQTQLLFEIVEKHPGQPANWRNGKEGPEEVCTTSGSPGKGVPEEGWEKQRHMEERMKRERDKEQKGFEERWKRIREDELKIEMEKRKLKEMEENVQKKMVEVEREKEKVKWLRLRETRKRSRWMLTNCMRKRKKLIGRKMKLRYCHGVLDTSSGTDACDIYTTEHEDRRVVKGLGQGHQRYAVNRMVSSNAAIVLGILLCIAQRLCLADQKCANGATTTYGKERILAKPRFVKQTQPIEDGPPNIKMEGNDRQQANKDNITRPTNLENTTSSANVVRTVEPQSSMFASAERLSK